MNTPDAFEQRQRDELRILVANRIEHATASYVRERDLDKLIRRDIWEGKSTREIVALLQAKVNGGAKKIARGYWAAPDHNRMIDLRGALRAEQARDGDEAILIAAE